MADQRIACAQCGNSHHAGDPFCPHCGEPLPATIAQGDLQVVVQEVASQKLRDLLVDTLQLWFPSIEPFRAQEGLKSGEVVLVDGVDQESAQRIVNALKSMKVAARVDRNADSWTRRLWNPGLLISVPAALALLFGGILTKLVALILGIGAPLVGALLRSASATPLVQVSQLPADSFSHERLAAHYAQVIRRLDDSYAGLVKQVAQNVFEIQRRLMERSLVSTAAGGDKGELYEKLDKAIPTALDLAYRLSVDDKDGQETLRADLEELSDAVMSTRDRLLGMESEDVREPHALATGIRQITDSIDRILQDARPHLSSLSSAARDRQPE